MRGAVFLLAVLSGLCGLAACGREAAPGTSAAAEHLEWRGSSSCADCDGIETVLVLQRDGQAHGYRLSETYLAAEGAARFDDAGSWEVEGAVLRMLGEGGSERRYAVLPDGRLQARDGAGRRLRSGDGEALEPVAVGQDP
ncbi:copper resistance protein NlpE N-terminal domain-containing protein [Luteimonas sp. SJ-92]|uniref:Copper resistance protein NlpE N-terminal domain-containing protein n=1 Tax=Luteimonas salinisoli TaxID=2752307 RepID=A0A853JAG0_9GAMM|nr:copper resistance protein NlpE N-terminal domain-containing protein [Luteimonas salinisoli]NZA25648.1 copper resistance protein NlpE N-terminal domain-containing protein [Luteimonas salinisoli]